MSQDQEEDEVTRLRAVVFDYGHTLINFTPVEDDLLDCYTEVRRLLEAEAYRELPEAPELVRALSNRVAAMVDESYLQEALQELDIVALYADALQAMGVGLPQSLVRRVVEMEHRANMLRITAPAPNLRLLQELRDRGLRLGLVSNAHYLPELMREDIERLGIAGFIDDAVFSSELGLRKPHPAIFLKVLGELGVSPGEAVFVGDRLRDDIGGAKGLGMRAILTMEYRQEELDEAPAKPDYVVERLPDILAYVDDLTV